MTPIPDSARAVPESPALAHLVTLNPDGSPQVTVVRVGLDGDEIVAAHLPEHRKVRNIRNDRRVALPVENREPQCHRPDRVPRYIWHRTHYRGRGRRATPGTRSHLPGPRCAVPARAWPTPG